MTRRARPEHRFRKPCSNTCGSGARLACSPFHPANGGWRTPIEGAILKGMGVAPGVPDVIAIKGGQAFCLELKADNGRLTEIQTETQQRMRAAGAIVDVAHGLDTALHWLETNGLLRGSTR